MKPLRILLDSGTTSSIILKPFLGLNSKFKRAKTKWNTMGGTFVTRTKARIQFKLPEFANNKIIEWTAHVDHVTSPKEAKYEMIIGSDLMTKIGMDLCYSAQTMT